MALKPIGLQTLDGDGDPRTGLRRRSSVLLYPPFEDISETALTENAIWSEVSGGGF